MKKGCFFVFIVVAVLFILAALAGLGGGASRLTEEPVMVMKLEGPIRNVDTLVKELHDYQKSETVKAVVLRIDSPGGLVGPSQEMYRQIQKFRKSGKVLVASMSSVAASGGYYIASAADQIYANAGTITGSIGVIYENFGLQDVLEKFNIDSRVMTAGKYKDAGNPFRDMKPEEKAYLQAFIDDLYEQFLKDVAKGRKLPLETIRELAEGKIYTGSQAHAVKLVDGLGNAFDAIEAAKALASLPEDAKVKWPKEPSPFDSFFEPEGAVRLMQKIRGFFLAEHLPSYL